MSAYYYLVSGLPDLLPDDSKLSYTLDRFREETHPKLDKADRDVMNLLYLDADNRAVLALLKNREAVVEEGGVFTTEQLSRLIDDIKNGDETEPDYPSYLCEFLANYFTHGADELNEAQLRDRLMAAYYAHAMKSSNQFVADWFEFNLNLNNILTALAARKYNMEVAPYIVGDNEVSEQLRKSNARDFGLSEQVDYFESLAKLAETDEWLGRERKVDRMKWKWLEDASFFHYFTVEKLFAFVLKSQMIRRWIALDKETGNEHFRKLINGLKEDVKIPQEFRK